MIIGANLQRCYQDDNLGLCFCLRNKKSNSSFYRWRRVSMAAVSFSASSFCPGPMFWMMLENWWKKVCAQSVTCHAISFQFPNQIVVKRNSKMFQKKIIIKALIMSNAINFKLHWKNLEKVRSCPTANWNFSKMKYWAHEIENEQKSVKAFDYSLTRWGISYWLTQFTVKY